MTMFVLLVSKRRHLVVRPNTYLPRMVEVYVTSNPEREVIDRTTWYKGNTYTSVDHLHAQLLALMGLLPRDAKPK